MANIQELVEQFGNLTLNEAVELRKALEKKYGVVPARQITKIVDTLTPEEKEPSTYSVTVTEVNDKIKTIKEVKSILNIGLVDAKNLVTSVPFEVKKGLTMDEATVLSATLINVNCKVEIKEEV